MRLRSLVGPQWLSARGYSRGHVRTALTPCYSHWYSLCSFIAVFFPNRSVPDITATVFLNSTFQCIDTGYGCGNVWQKGRAIGCYSVKPPSEAVISEISDKGLTSSFARVACNFRMASEISYLPLQAGLTNSSEKHPHFSVRLGQISEISSRFVRNSDMHIGVDTSVCMKFHRRVPLFWDRHASRDSHKRMKFHLVVSEISDSRLLWSFISFPLIFRAKGYQISDGHWLHLKILF